MPNQKKILQTFIQMTDSSPRLDISEVASELGITHEEFFDYLVEWSDLFEFEIENEQIITEITDEIKKKILHSIEKSKDSHIINHKSFTGAKFYQNVPLVNADYNFLRILEQLIKSPIFETNRENFFKGFVAENGHIIMLGMSYMDIAQIPASIGDLEQLTHLYLGNLNLKILPNEIGRLFRLEYLNLTNNKLKSIPDEIGNLISLKYLNMDYNYILHLPDSLKNLIELQNLTIEENKLNLKTSFSILNHLRKIGCNIEKKNAFNWSEVGNEEIICNSGLKQDDFITELFKLSPLLSFEESCIQMVMKQQKDMRFEEPEDYFKWDISKPKPTENEISKDIDYSWALFYNDVPLVKDEYDLMVYLESQIGSQIPSVPSVIMKFGFTAEEGHIVELGFYWQNLTKIPEVLILFKQLRTLYLGKNYLSSIPIWINELTQLEFLNLAENSIFSVPESLGKLDNLKHLDISHNRLISLPSELKQLSKLKYLNIDNNQLNMKRSAEVLDYFQKMGCQIENSRAYRMPVLKKL